MQSIYYVLRPGLPAETEVQAGIVVESPKWVAPIAIGGVAGLGTPACRNGSTGRNSPAPIFFRGAAKTLSQESV